MVDENFSLVEFAQNNFDTLATDTICLFVTTRPIIPVNTEAAKPVEKFMHGVLRPVLKQANDQLLMSAINRLQEKKIQYKNLSLKERISLLEKLVSTDQKFKLETRKLIVDLFSKSELEFYNSHKRELNKRITTMLYERLLTQWNY